LLRLRVFLHVSLLELNKTEITTLIKHDNNRLTVMLTDIAGAFEKRHADLLRLEEFYKQHFIPVVANRGLANYLQKKESSISTKLSPNNNMKKPQFKEPLCQKLIYLVI